MKFLKESDCCQKELYPTKPCSCLFPFKVMAQSFHKSYCVAGERRPEKKWMLHTAWIIAHFRTVRLNLWSTNCTSWKCQPTFVSHWLFFPCPAVNKLCSEQSPYPYLLCKDQADLIRLRVKVTTSRQQYPCRLEVTKKSTCRMTKF